MKQFVLVLLSITYLTATQYAFAAPTPTPTCVPVFGGGPSCVQQPPVRINKQVRDPKSGKYVDTLSTPYGPGDEVTFHIFVTNIADKDLKDINIQDVFPSYLTFAYGDGIFDFNKQTFTASLTSLTKGESKAISVTGTVVSADKLPTLPSPLCISNLATATHEGKTSSDTTPFCLSKTASNKILGSATQPTQPTTRNTKPGSTTKGGLPIHTQPSTATTKKTPDTGPEDVAYIALAITALGGFYLRRRTATLRIK